MRLPHVYFASLSNRFLGCLAIWLSVAMPLAAQTVADVTVPAPNGSLILRLWMPDGVARLRGVMVQVHGLGGDDRGVADASGGDAVFQLLAQRNAFGLIGVKFTSGNPNESAGTNDVNALTAGIDSLAAASSHPELTTAPIVIAGMSAGSGYAVNVANYLPGRVIAFAHNKGISYPQLSKYYGLSGAYQTPGIICYGELDRTDASPYDTSNDRAPFIKDAFNGDRAGGALWCLLPDWGLAHDDQGYGRYFGALFLDRMIQLRIPSTWIPGTAPTLLPLDETTGWLGDNGLQWAPLSSGGYVPRDVVPSLPVTITSFASSSATLVQKRVWSWLPDEALANAWRAAATKPYIATLQSPRSAGGLNQAHRVLTTDRQIIALIPTAATGITGITWLDGITTLASVTTSPFTASATPRYGFHPILGRLSTAAGTATTDLTVLAVTRGANQAPVLVSGPSASAVRLTESLPVTLSAAAADPDGGLEGLLTYTWSVVSGPGAVTFPTTNGSNAGKGLSAIFAASGTYIVRLTVTDAEGLTVVSNLSVVIFPAANQAPQIVIAAVTVPAVSPLRATLSATVTDDGLPVGAVVTILWTQVSGPGVVAFANPNGPMTTADFSLPGDYVVRLTATDGVLNTIADLTIPVPLPINQAPIVDLGAARTIAGPSSITLGGSVTDDGLPAGGSLTYSWNLAAGSDAVVFAHANQIDPLVTFTLPGIYQLRLTVSDGEKSTVSILSVTVLGRDPLPIESGSGGSCGLGGITGLMVAAALVCLRRRSLAC